MPFSDTELQKRLVSTVRRFAEQKIVIIGDAIADKFLHGSISRVSREAPVFILRHQQTETLPGGAANCAMNLVALGARVRRIQQGEIVNPLTRECLDLVLLFAAVQLHVHRRRRSCNQILRKHQANTFLN